MEILFNNIRGRRTIYDKIQGIKDIGDIPNYDTQNYPSVDYN